MRFYDIANLRTESSFSKRLGFYRIYQAGIEIDVQDAGKQQYKKKAIATGSAENLLARALKERNVIGILPKAQPSKRLIAMVADSNKVLFINVNDAIRQEGKAQLKSIYLYRKTLQYCRKSKAKASPITLAESEEYLLSARQLMTMAKFLGFSGDEKEALSILGVAYGEKD